MKYFCSFSEAIREGIKIRPRQCFNHFFEGDDASCATGAAIEATLERPLDTEEILLNPKFRETTRPLAELYAYMRGTAKAPCICVEMYDSAASSITGQQNTGDFSLYNICVHLNNYHQWTREAIADWLEQEEEKLGFVTLVESESSVSLSPRI